MILRGSEESNVTEPYYLVKRDSEFLGIECDGTFSVPSIFSEFQRVECDETTGFHESLFGGPEKSFIMWLRALFKLFRVSKSCMWRNNKVPGNWVWQKRGFPRDQRETFGAPRNRTSRNSGLHWSFFGVPKSWSRRKHIPWCKEF